MAPRVFYRCKGLLVPLFLGLLVACGDINMFSPFGSDEEQSWFDLSFSTGEVLSSGRQITLTVKEPRELDDPAPARMQISFLDGTGAVIDTREVLDPYERDPWIPLPETIPEGSSYLQLLIDLFDNQGSLLDSRKVDFFVADQVPDISALEVYPPGGIETGYQCIIQARTDLPLDDVYLRWTMGDQVLARGTGAELSDQLVWSAPDQPGVYELGLEIFPEPPPVILNGSYPFPAAERKTIELFVSKGLDEDALAALADRFIHYFPFAGNIENVGGLGDLSVLEGVVQPSLFNGSFGYLFPSDAYINLPIFSADPLMQEDAAAEDPFILTRTEPGDETVRESPADEPLSDGLSTFLPNHGLTDDIGLQESTAALHLSIGAAAAPEGEGRILSLFQADTLLMQMETGPENSILLTVNAGFRPPPAIEEEPQEMEAGDEMQDSADGEAENGPAGELERELEPEGELEPEPDPEPEPGPDMELETEPEPENLLDPEIARQMGFPEDAIVFRYAVPVEEELVSGELLVKLYPVETALELVWSQTDRLNEDSAEPVVTESFLVPLYQTGERPYQFLPDHLVVGGDVSLFLSRIGVVRTDIQDQDMQNQW